MSKDPALLWYFSDWNGGTMTMSRHLKGCYMDVLSAQFFNGPLSLDEIKTVLGSDFGSAWPALQKKFTQTSEGNFYNERLQAEKSKRAAFSESRRQNRKKSLDKSHDMSSDKHMLPHMENENRNENTIEDENKGGAGGKTNTMEPVTWNLEPVTRNPEPACLPVRQETRNPEPGTRTTLHFGEPDDYRITVRPRYVSDPILIIHDLREFFKQNGQLAEITKAGWTDFTGFMRTNPGAFFNDTDHVYNAFRTYSTKAAPSEKSDRQRKREYLKTI